MWVCRLRSKRRNPLSAKGSGAYHVGMADIDIKQFLNTEAVPFSITVAEHRQGWYLRVWYAGRTMAEALRPILVAEYVIASERIPAGVTWGQIMQETAIALSELGRGLNTTYHR